MAERSSQTKTSGDLLIISFARGLARELKRGQNMVQATQERTLIQLGQVLEVQRQILAAVTAKPTEPPSGLMSQWAWLKDRLAEFVLLQKAWSAWRAISWPVSFGSWGYIVGRALGWL